MVTEQELQRLFDEANAASDADNGVSGVLCDAADRAWDAYYAAVDAWPVERWDETPGAQAAVAEQNREV